MEDGKRSNHVFLRGTLCEAPHFSHESQGEHFYQFSLEIHRLSGTADRIHILARSSLLDTLEIDGSSKICVLGELRSFNNKSGVGPKLIITVFAREIRFDDGEDENLVELLGTLCKAPAYRTTPFGREIADMMLAVNRAYGKSDYIPCITWGRSARFAAKLSVGDRITLSGRLQSRAYQKQMPDGTVVEKTAYEVSVGHLELLEGDALCADPTSMSASEYHGHAVLQQ